MTSETDNDAASHSQSPDDSGDQDAGETMENQDMDDKNGEQSKEGSEQKKTSSNSKDPSRPRRKKARRACYACQRAHLTCGDERPCQRCIKRGLQDACQDGVRKKAKYLHDAPNEALLPGATTHYQYMNNLRRTHQNPQSPTYPLTPTNEMYGQRPGPSLYSAYGPPVTSTPLSMPDNLMSAQLYVNQQSPIATQFPVSSGQVPTSMQTLVQAMDSSAPPGSSTIQDFGGNIFDGNDPTQYNFDPASFNFGNHYGALEFGILNHISSGAAETPPSDSQSLGQSAGGPYATPVTINTTFGESPAAAQPYLFNQDQGWRTPTQPQSNVRQSGTSNTFAGNVSVKQEGPNAFSIGDGPAFASPTSERSPQARPGFEDNKPVFANNSAPSSRPSTQGRWTQSQSQQPQAPQSSHGPMLVPNRRRGDPSAIYANVTQPYSYTSGFHSLIAFLQNRFSSQSTLRIAKALASIRPSFLSCTKTLGREDLIFMEKCFQRTLWEYEDFINACGTPTIVCRRTGEVAAVGKEFSILTGWKKDVLLGKAPNLNVNIGGGPSGGSAAGGSSRGGGGVSTPRIPEGAIDPSRPQPVFLAELLDDDSVIEFYEDFAKLAFGDSRGGVTTRCKLLKYRKKEDEEATAEEDEDAGTSLKRKRAKGQIGGGKSEIAGQTSIDELGDKNGKVECSCCWTVKRDLFDLPMM